MTSARGLAGLLARRSGQLLSLAAVAFLVWLAVEHRHAILTLLVDPAALSALIGLGVLYGLLLASWALPWRALLNAVSDHPLPGRTALRAHLTTQVAKYLPGNVLHLAGRHLQLSAAGIGHRSLFIAIAWEIAFMMLGVMLAGALLVLVTGGLAFPGGEAAGSRPIAGRPAIGLCVAILSVVVLMVMAHRRVFGIPIPPSRVTLYCAIVMTLIFLGQGVVFVVVAWAISGAYAPELAAVAVIAWVAGFLTPGAPGGLGVRELVIVGMAASIVSEPVAIATATVFRGITIIGDIVCLGIGLTLNDTARRPGEDADATRTNPAVGERA